MTILSAVRAAVLCTCACVAVWSSPALAQERSPDEPRPGSLALFVDCAFTCDQDFFRTEIRVVDYARDRNDADVHLLLTSEPTADGIQYRASFIGLRGFAGRNQALTYLSPRAATDDERRHGLVRIVKLGLVAYLAETALADRVNVTFSESTPSATMEPADDPWKLWVVRATFGGTMTGERSSTGRSLRLGASANRTGETWKVTAAVSGNYRDDSFALTDTQTFTSSARTVNATGLVVRTLTEHWSAGVQGNALESTFLNYDLKTRVAPGLEYNFFPYADSSRRMFTVQYTLGVGNADYRAETVFGKTSERLVDHRLATALTMLQPWGTATAEVSLSQYLTRRDQYNATAFGSVNVRLLRGLSVNIYSSVSRTNDQIYLPREDASTEEILVRERQLATSYRYSVNFGFVYTFGSRFNNVVNRRFGLPAADSSEF